MDRGIWLNLLILAGMVPLTVGVAWGLVLLVNKSTGFDLEPILKKIYSNPMSAAVYRGVVVWSCFWLVGTIFSRWV